MLNTISKDLGITKEPYEDKAAWQYRIKYSILGLQMLSALYDKYDDFEDDTLISDSVSRQHITSRAKKLAEIFGIEQDNCEDILNLYTKMGFILEKRNRLAYPPVSTAQAEQGFIARGIHPSATLSVSGLGFLIKADNATMSNVDDMFNLSTVDTMKWYAIFMDNARGEWKPNEDLADFEFLNAQVNPWKSYWIDIAPKSGIALCRGKDTVGRVYKLLSIKTDNVKSLQLPEWNTKNGEYLRLAIALRIVSDNPPQARVKKYDRTSLFEYDYLLPPSEQSFIEVYSWKRDNSQDEVRWPQSRIVANELYQVFITIFRRMGFEIEEE